MSTWTLSDIRTKVRKVTGRFSPSELTNDQIDKSINQYYQFTFPSEVKLEEKHVYYSFLTNANQAYYDMPQTTYTNFEPPATCNNLSMLWYQNPATFFQDNPLQYQFTNPWTGDGSTTAFSTTVTGFPIFPGTTVISDTVESFQDTNNDWTLSNVTVTGSLGGTLTINYDAGTLSVIFNSAPTDGQLIYANYVLFVASRPQAILMYNNQFQLYPVPDQQYIIKMLAYSIVSPLVLATDTPQLSEWGPCIAYGASRDIVADYGEMDSYAEITQLYKEQVAYVLKRTCQDLLNVRALPSY